jgi:DNA-binding GntR family transcriptional regulator
VTISNEKRLVGWPTKADRAYVSLRDQIFRGDLSPGARLDQDFLAGTLGVSTTPLREALRRLEAEHLVVRTAHRDVVIAPLSIIEARELFSVRMELDVMAIRLATESMTDDELSEGEAMLDSPGGETAIEYLRERGIAHHASLAQPRAFHHLLYRGSHNAVLIEALDALWARSERYFVAARAFPATPPKGGPSGSRSITQHRAMLAAVADNDADTAESLMRAHDVPVRVVERFLLGQATSPRRRRRITRQKISDVSFAQSS